MTRIPYSKLTWTAGRQVKRFSRIRSRPAKADATVVATGRTPKQNVEELSGLLARSAA